ncbi:MAG TPA: hypothetical protein VFF06_14375 [Polyangia bacterium]|nr:hypothetical protein [Polyangia bacterium]
MGQFAHSIRSSDRYGWPKLIFFWIIAGGLGLMLLAGVIYVIWIMRQ